MKLCFLGDAGSIHTVRIADYFAKKGHDVSLIGFDNPGIKKVKYCQLKKHFSFMDLNYPDNIPLLNKYLMQIKPDLLHAHYATSYGFMAAFSGFHPFLLTCWGSDILVTPKKNPFLRALTRHVLNKADAVTCDSEDMKSEIEELSDKGAKISKVYFGPEEKVLGVKPKKHNLKSILSLRGLESNYNIDKIIAAFSVLIADGEKAKLVILGEGRKKEALLRLTELKGLSALVEFKGRVKNNLIPHYLSLSDVVVSVPSSDSTAASLLEAMAAGCIPVVSGIPANKEWVKEKVNGFIADDLDPEPLGYILRMALNNANISKMRKNNKEKVRKYGTFEKNMQVVEKIYFSLTKRKK
ncbi:MAG: hypothetical protein A2044_00375 [Candidatus Firestonebacteria bacterium GWA2_43_8]|nr:MAG: hypothetical protein A2044_00375 [Candidatus Firestonebacteria bacterium GWA2_43_8]